MKKIIAILFLCFISVIFAVGFAACDNNDKSGGGDETHTHIYDSGVITKQPNCTEQGEITFSCSCGATYTAKVPVLGHDYQAEIIAPTCTEQGYTKHTCVKCGDSYNDNYVEKLEHNYEWTTTKQPTETEDGIKTGICKLCGDRITKIIPSLNHEHNYIITIIEPTCTKNGYTLHKCACGDKYIDNETAALGHTPAAAIEENIQKATCIENGSYDSVVYCTVCHTELTREEKTIPATGHEFTHYVSDGNATYESDGTKTAYCNNGCGTTDTVPDIGSKLVYSGITFNTLTVSGTNVNGKVPNSQNTFSFLTEINVSGGATYSVSYDINGNNTIPNKTVNLNIGDNIFYVLEMVDGEASNLFTLTIRRRPIYTVSFNSNGGTSVASQQIEEDSFATEPTTTRTGYTFTEWDCDFNKQIIKSTTITASWAANTNTKYKVEYYLQNLEDNNYTLDHTDNLMGTTDTQTTAEIKTFEHFTHTTISNSIESANINCDETTTLKVYYTRDKYTIKLVAGENVTLNRSYNGSYKYGYQIEEITAMTNLGYDLKGWYDNEEFLTSDVTIPSFTVDKPINYVAKAPVKDEMSNFNFTSTDITCTITGIQDKTVMEIIVPDYVTSIGDRAFFGCSSLTSITIGNGVTSIGAYAFTNCSSLTSITIGNGVTSIGGDIFQGCNSLTSVTIGNSVKSIGGRAFSGCSNLTSVVIPDSVTSISWNAFYNCSSLTSITIPDSVISIGDRAFYNCSSLTSITIPDSVISIGDRAFSGCSSLTSITIPNSVTSIGYDAFSGCSSLTSVIIGDSVTSIGNYAFSGCYSLTSITIPDSVTSIGEWAFYNCSSLTSITIPDSVTSICRYAFKGCSSLTSITIPDSVTSIGYDAFSGCSSLTSVIIGDSVTSIGDCAFQSCRSLTSVTIGGGVKSIGAYTFYDCSSLTSINVDNNNPNYKSIDGNLYNKDGTTLIQYAIGKTATTFTIPNSVTSIGDRAFSGCSSLTSITIPDSVTSIGEWAFYNCSSLTSITIPDSVTSICRYAFSYCSSLTSITIPDSVTSIGEMAFYNCSSLTSVTFVNTSGWKVSKYSNMSNYTSLSSSSLANQSTAALYLKSNYMEYYWKRG